MDWVIFQEELAKSIVIILVIAWTCTAWWVVGEWLKMGRRRAGGG